MRRLGCCLLLSSIVVVSCTDPTNQKNTEPRTITSQPTNENRLPGQYIVTLKEGGNSETLINVFQQYGIKAIQDLSKGRYLIILEHDPGPEEIAKKAATVSEIHNLQPNSTYHSVP